MISDLKYLLMMTVYIACLNMINEKSQQLMKLWVQFSLQKHTELMTGKKIAKLVKTNLNVCHARKFTQGKSYLVLEDCKWSMILSLSVLLANSRSVKHFHSL